MREFIAKYEAAPLKKTTKATPVKAAAKAPAKAAPARKRKA